MNTPVIAASINRPVAAKDWLEFRRDRRLAIMAVMVTLLALAAVATAWIRVTAHETDRQAVMQADRTTWNGQGARNPHSAAHFGFWAMRPLGPMALLDPGVTPHAGAMVWMEAHNRNPAQARPVDDQASGLDLGSFSAAWVLQLLMPLLIFIIGAGMVAREREAGTLRLMLASGADLRRLLPAKTASLARIAALIALPLLAAAAAAAVLAGLPDVAALGLWLLVHGLWFALLVAATVLVSALCPTAARARLLLVGLWLLAVVLVPRAAAGIAGIIAPAPDPVAFGQAIEAQMKSGHDAFGKDAKAFEAEVMARYKVKRLEDLPVNIDGLRLEAAEQHGNRVFDSAWAGLAQTYARQNRIMQLAGLFSPLLPLQNVSMALAGTDGAHQMAFQAQAEAHRRRIVTALNMDMAAHAGRAGFDYKADRALWQAIPDFRYQPLPLANVLAAILPDLALLGLWGAALVLALRRAGRRLALA
jgi:ABC-2 type transport system permease protein